MFYTTDNFFIISQSHPPGISPLEPVVNITTQASRLQALSGKCGDKNHIYHGGEISQAKLSKLQRLACLGITGTMITAIAAIEVLLGLPPLHLKIEAEACAGICRLICNEHWRLRTFWYDHMSKSLDMMREPILQVGTDKMIVMHSTNHSVRLLDRSEWDGGIVPFKKRGLAWYIDGSKINEVAGAGVYGRGMGQRFSVSLGQYAVVFQAKYILSRHVLMRILKRAIVIGFFSDS
jgi:hypothetical protein